MKASIFPTNITCNKLRKIQIFSSIRNSHHKNILFFSSESIKFLLNPGHNPHLPGIPVESDSNFCLVEFLCHFLIHSRQQVAVACWAIKTGCPLSRCLLPIIGNYCRCFSFGNEIPRMFSYSFQPFSLI